MARRLVVAAILATLAACSTAGGPLVVVAGAGEAAAEQGTVLFEAVARSTAAEFELRIEGGIDFEAGLARATIRTEASDEDSGVRSVAYTCEAVFSEGWFYVSVPEDRRAEYDGKAWVRSSIDAAEQAAAMLDPRQLLDALREVARDIEEQGREDVRGVATTRYRLTVDTEKWIDRNVPENERERERRQYREARDRGEEVFPPIDVWIDGDGLPRRLVTTIPTVSTESRIEFFDYGAPAGIAVPREDETRTIESGSAFDACVPRQTGERREVEEGGSGQEPEIGVIESSSGEVTSE